MRRININQLILLMILSSASFYIFYLLLSGSIKSFIHPRMTAFMYIALISLMVMSAFQTTRIFELGPVGVKKGTVIFLLPILAAFFLQPNELGGDLVYDRGIIISQGNICTEHEHNSELCVFEKNQIISLNENNYAKALYTIWSDPDKYESQRISLEGFVCHTGEPGKVIIARTVISCCVADSVIMGLPVEYSGELKENQWVAIEGTIRTMEVVNPSTHKKEKLQGIAAEKIKLIDKPEEPYIYQ